MPSDKTFYTVVESYDGEISVCSFCCDTRAEERRAALTTNRKVHSITRDYAAAQRLAAELRRNATAKVE